MNILKVRARKARHAGTVPPLPVPEAGGQEEPSVPRRIAYRYGTAVWEKMAELEAEAAKMTAQLIAEDQAQRQAPPGVFKAAVPSLPDFSQPPPWYGYGTTMPDQRAAHDRPYVPARPRPAADLPAPGLAADLADLPAFREALAMRTRCHAGQCLCGHPVTGTTWGERMVAAGTHLLGGAS